MVPATPRRSHQFRRQNRTAGDLMATVSLETVGTCFESAMGHNKSPKMASSTIASHTRRFEVIGDALNWTENF